MSFSINHHTAAFFGKKKAFKHVLSGAEVESTTPKETNEYAEALNENTLGDRVPITVAPKKAKKTRITKLITTVHGGKLSKVASQRLKDLGVTVEGDNQYPVISLNGFTLQSKKPGKKEDKDKVSQILGTKPNGIITNIDHVALNVRDFKQAKELLTSLGFKAPKDKKHRGYTIGKPGEKLWVKPFMDKNGNVVNIVYDAGGKCSVVSKQLDYEGVDASLHHLAVLVNSSNTYRNKGLLGRFLQQPSMSPALLSGTPSVETMAQGNKFLSQAFFAPLADNPYSARIEGVARQGWQWFNQKNSDGLENSIK